MKTKESNPEKGLEWRPLHLGRVASDCFTSKLEIRNFYALLCSNFWNSKYYMVITKFRKYKET